MPSYKVLQTGFYEGKLYDPRGRRPVLTTDHTITPLPFWLEKLEGETARQSAARRGAETKSRKSGEKAIADKKIEVDSVNFTGDNVVQTL